MGEWVLRTACRQLASWRFGTALGAAVMAVNVSARQFHHPDFVSQVLGALQDAGADRFSGGQGDAPRTYAREYFRCVTNDGALVWLFRDAQEKSGGWYLHGWWD